MLKLDKSKIVTNLGKKYKLVPYLEKAFATFDEPWTFTYEEKKPDDAWHPSGHCTLSPDILYKIAITQTDSQESETETISGSLRKTFQVGHFWHQLIQHIVLTKLEFCGPEDIERRGQFTWGWYDPNPPLRETASKSFHWARGSGDIVPCKLPGGWEGIIDIKTMAAQQYKQNDIPAWAADKYECQMNIYMSFFDQEEAMILAVCKDSPHEFKELLYKRNQPLIDTIFHKWEFVSECLDAKTSPSALDDEMFRLPVIGTA